MILNHLWPTRVPGGYVGVDIFFVISGHLISAHLLGEFTRTNRIRFGAFYARRAKRLLPAALLVSFTALGASILLLPPERWSRIAAETFAASAYVENWFLAANSVDYSAQSLDATTVQHYWSLSVEEQFYLAWPLLLLALLTLGARLSRGPGRRWFLLVGICVLGALSFAFAVWLTSSSRSLAYFHTLTRVWEFMAGAALAVLPGVLSPIGGAGIRPRIPGRIRSVVQGTVHWAACIALLFSALRFSDATAFPGPWAALPVAATALIIATGENEPSWSPLRLLRWRPVQFAGDISYSLYLWHWPLIVLLPFALGRQLGTLDRALVIVATVLLAALTKRYVEDPGRTLLLPRARPRATLFLTAASIAVAGALCGAAVFGAGALQARQEARIQTLAATDCFGAGALEPGSNCSDPFGPAVTAPQGDHNAPWFSPSECALAPVPLLAQGKPSLVECDFARPDQDPASAPTVWLVGDSHAEHWKAPVFEVARGNGWRVNAAMQGGCPIIDVHRAAFKGAADEGPEKSDECRRWGNELSERIVASAPDLVLVSVFSAQETLDDGTGRDQEEQYRAPTEQRLQEWRDAGAQVVVIRDVPYAEGVLDPNCVLQRPEDPLACSAAQATVLAEDATADAARELGAPGITVIDLSDRFCRDDTCYAVIGGVPVYFDGDHISQTYARTLAPALGSAIATATGWTVAAPVAEAKAAS